VNYLIRLCFHCEDGGLSLFFFKNLRWNIFSVTKMHVTSHAKACEKFLQGISFVLWIFGTVKLNKVLKSSVFWYVTPYRLVKGNRVCCTIHGGFLLDFFLNSEERGDIFLRNISWLSSDYTELYLRWQNSTLPPLWEPEILQAKSCLYSQSYPRILLLLEHSIAIFALCRLLRTVTW
jgi:hypothetical protein